VQPNANCVGTYIGDGYTSEIPSLLPPARPVLGLHLANPLTSLCYDNGMSPKHVQRWGGAPMKGSNFDVGDELQSKTSNSNLLSFNGSGRSSVQPIAA
jgi:hypothetical protein